jgi:PAS domain S-box-containing protein
VKSFIPLSALIQRFFLRRLVAPLMAFAVFCCLLAVVWRIHQIYQAHYLFAKGMDHTLSFWMSQANQTLRHLAWEKEDSPTVPPLLETAATDFHRIVFAEIQNLDGPYPVDDERARRILGLPLSFFPDKHEWPTLSVPYFSRDHGALTVGILVRADRWAAFGELKLDLLYRLVSGFRRQDPGKLVVITDRYGNVIYHPDENYVRERENLAHEPLIRAALRHAQPMDLYGKLEGRWIFANSWRVDPWGWVIIVGQPLVPVIAPVIAATITVTAFILFVTALLAWRFRIGLEFAVVDPIRSFGRHMDSLAEGRADLLGQAVSGEPTFLELAQFQEQFRKMSEAVRVREQALRAQGQELDRVLESISDGVIVTDTDSRIRRMNAAAEELTGCNRLQTMGKPMERIFLFAREDGQAALTEAVSRALSTGTASHLTHPIQLQGHDGDLLHLAVRVAPLRDGLGNVLGVVTVFSDITEQVENRKRLLESEQKFRTLAEMSPVAVLLYQDDRWVYANPAAEAVCGFSREELTRQNFWDLVHPEFRALVRERGRSRQQGLNVESGYEMKIITKTGQEKWCYLRGDTTLYEGRPAGIVAVMDITSLKEAQQALAESERKYREIMESMEEAYLEMDLQGAVTFYNPAFLRLLACNPEDLRHRTYHDFADVSNVRRMELFFSDVLRHGKTRSLQDFVIRDARGRQKIIEVSAGVRRNEDGTVSGVRMLARDVSEKVRAEEKSRSLEKMLIQAQKMESLGTLASGVAHEFNNLLQAMSGYLELALKATSPEDPRKKWLSRVHEATRKAGDLVKRLLAFARPSDPHLEPVHINRVIEDTLLILERSIPRMIEVTKDLDPEVPTLLADKLQLEQVIINLVANSRDAMPPEKPGTIRIRTEKITGKDGTPWVQITLSDTGLGIPEEIQDRIFDPFFTTKEPGKGTGLGLSTVYGIIRRHGGTIHCRSLPGEGTTFTIRLPGRASLPKETHAAPPRDDDGLEPGSGDSPNTVLVVDDEEPLLDFIQTALELEDFRVMTATSGEEALEILRRSNGSIQWVLLDLNMPGMGGRQCLDEIRSRFPHIRILVASGYPVHTLAEQPETFGVTAFLQKPYRFAELVAILKGS